MIEIELNGVLHPVPDAHNLEALIASLDLAGKGIAVAINREVVPRQQWPQRWLQPQDRVDIVRAIGGG
ncbi:MAG: sulfur carrier protein ThiS [Glaciimonas sp.]|nr:sulfur carrier protein ThiS [Glaciimonas sp.]